MARVLKNFHQNLAMEVARGEKSVAYVYLDGAAVTLGRMPKRQFDEEYQQPAMNGHGEAAVEITPRRLSRHYLGLKQFPIQSGAAAAMVDIMALLKDEPRSDLSVLLCESQSGRLIGCYENIEDALLVTRYLGAEAVSVVRRPADMVDWPAAQLEALRQQVAPGLKTKSRTKLMEGVFAMAKAAEKQAAAAPKKVEATVKERKPKEDGPVALVKAFVAKHEDQLRSGKMTRADARAKLIDMGINKGTIGVQLPKALVVMKIKAVAGGTVKVNAEGKAEVKKPAEPKASKTKAAKKAAPAPSTIEPAKSNGKGPTAATKTAAPKKAGKEAAARA